MVVEVLLKKKPEEQPALRRETWTFRHADWGGLRSHLSGIDWKRLTPADNPETGLDNLYKELERALAIHIPRRKVRPHRHKPWYSEDLNPLRRAKERAYYRWKSEDYSAEMESEYKMARRNYHAALKRQKARFASQVAMKINGMKGKQWWKEVDKVLGRSAVRGVPPLFHQGSQIMASYEKAVIFNRMFAEKSVVPDPTAIPAPIDRKCEKTVSTVRFHSRIVAKLLRQIDPTKAPGLDDIPGIVLKECAKELSYPLARIFQASMNTGIFP